MALQPLTTTHRTLKYKLILRLSSFPYLHIDFLLFRQDASGRVKVSCTAIMATAFKELRARGPAAALCCDSKLP